MPGFTQATAQNILNAQLRGVAFTAPTGIEVGLFTALPSFLGDVTTELTDSGYTRMDAAAGGALSSGWAAPDANGQTSNAKTIPFPQMLNIADGATVTVPAFGIFDSVTGVMLYRGEFAAPVILQPNGSITLDPGVLTVKLGDA